MPPAGTKTSRPSLSDQLRGIIQSRGTAYSAAKDSGLDPGVASRFLSHERGLTTQSLDKLTETLGLRLIETDWPARRPAKGRAPARRTAAGPAVVHEPSDRWKATEAWPLGCSGSGGRRRSGDRLPRSGIDEPPQMTDVGRRHDNLMAVFARKPRHGGKDDVGVKRGVGGRRKTAWRASARNSAARRKTAVSKGR